jgi:phosphatidylglycerophosphatase A
MRKFAVKILSTFFYVGYLPLIPGTFASLAGLGVFYLIRNDPVVYAAWTLVVVALGFLITGEAERIFGVKDCRYIVIDEVAGVLLALMFIPNDIRLVIAGFIIFRIFDTLKLYPAGRLQHLRGSLGVMCDDITAGLYTNIILQIVLRLASLSAS